MSQPRVLHIAPLLFCESGGMIGGAERYVFELAKHMAARTVVRLLTFGPNDESYSVGSLEVHVKRPWFLVKGQKSNPFWGGLPSEIGGFDVIHCHQKHILLSSTAAVVARLMRKRVFVTDLGGGGWDVSAYVSTDSWYHGELHLSEYSRRIFGKSDHPGNGLIFGGVDSEKFSPPAIPQAGSYFLYVGRILPHKGIDRVIEALGPQMKLVVIGQRYSDSYFEELRRLAEGKQVEFRTGVGDAELVTAYRNCRAILLTSLYCDRYGNHTSVPELLGQSLLEGMACGKPAIATNVASLPEVVTDGLVGFLVSPDRPHELRERLETLWQDPKRAMEMGVSARKVILDRFTWSSVVDRCLNYYDRAR